MLCLHRVLFLFTLTAWVVVAAPVVETESRQVLSAINQELSDGYGVLGQVLSQTGAGDPTVSVRETYHGLSAVGAWL